MTGESLQLRAMDDYFNALLFDDAAIAEPSPARALVSRPHVARPPQSLSRPVPTRVTPAVVDCDPLLTRLSELLAPVSPWPLEGESVAVVSPSSQPLLTECAQRLSLADEPQTESEPELSESVLSAACVRVADAAPAQPSTSACWQNINTEHEFQALFFEVAGVTFAVPLAELGGIHQLGEVTSLFGQPDWYQGIMTSREQQMNVVDTAKWVMPGQSVATEDYHYLVMLGESAWGLACHHLKGTELVRREQVKWRNQGGKRPWLAGMVKEKMCALLHVQELLLLLARGVNVTGC